MCSPKQIVEKQADFWNKDHRPDDLRSLTGQSTRGNSTEGYKELVNERPAASDLEMRSLAWLERASFHIVEATIYTLSKTIFRRVQKPNDCDYVRNNLGLSNHI